MCKLCVIDTPTQSKTLSPQDSLIKDAYYFTCTPWYASIDGNLPWWGKDRCQLSCNENFVHAAMLDLVPLYSCRHYLYDPLGTNA